jgi:hypothetical protein
METLTANLAPGRKATFQGRDYVVAPVTLIVPGVLNGTAGPLFYPADEVSRSPGIWNSVPIVVNHPSKDGDWVSARRPDVLEKIGVGHVFNARFEDGKLKADAWFDVRRVQTVEPKLFTALNAQKQFEVSTGLNFDSQKADEGASHNGKAYTHVVSNFRPDHLAILPDQIGACSIKDGCGLFVNTNRRHEGGSAMDETKKKAVVDFIIANCAYCDESDREALNARSDEKLLKQEKALKDEKAELEKATNAAKVAVDKAKAIAKPFKTTDGVERGACPHQGARRGLGVRASSQAGAQDRGRQPPDQRRRRRG